MQRPSMALVCRQHSDDLAPHAGEAWLRECRHHGICVAGVCDGANMLARAGLLRDRRARSTGKLILVSLNDLG